MLLNSQMAVTALSPRKRSIKEGCSLSMDSNLTGKVVTNPVTVF